MLRRILVSFFLIALAPSPAGALVISPPGLIAPKLPVSCSTGAATYVNPKTLCNLIAWFDASDTSSITASSGAVSKLADKSGNGYDATQTTPANQPSTGINTLNGLNVITTSSSKSLTIPTLPTNIPAGDNTVFVLWKNSGDNQFSLSGYVGGSQVWGLYYTDFQGHATAANGGGAKVNVSSPSSAQHLQILRRAGTSVDSVWDGSLTNAATGTNQTITNGYYIGNGATMYIGEIVIYNRSLRNTEIDQVAGALAAKWGTTWTNI